jgi:hypothetical protein
MRITGQNPLATMQAIATWFKPSILDALHFAMPMGGGAMRIAPKTRRLL